MTGAILPGNNVITWPHYKYTPHTSDLVAVYRWLLCSCGQCVSGVCLRSASGMYAVGVRVCVCVCVSERERACVRAWVCACLCVCKLYLCMDVLWVTVCMH